MQTLRSILFPLCVITSVSLLYIYIYIMYICVCVHHTSDSFVAFTYSSTNITFRCVCQLLQYLYGFTLHKEWNFLRIGLRLRSSSFINSTNNSSASNFSTNTPAYCYCCCCFCFSLSGRCFCHYCYLMQLLLSLFLSNKKHNTTGNSEQNSRPKTKCF